MDTSPSGEEPETTEIEGPTISAGFVKSLHQLYGEGANPQVDLPEGAEPARTAEQRTKKLTEQTAGASRYEM